MVIGLAVNNAVGTWLRLFTLISTESVVVPPCVPVMITCIVAISSAATCGAVNVASVGLVLS